MARPKSEDPTVAITIRLKRSAQEWWAQRANEKGEPMRVTIQDALEARTKQ